MTRFFAAIQMLYSNQSSSMSHSVCGHLLSGTCSTHPILEPGRSFVIFRDPRDVALSAYKMRLMAWRRRWGARSWISEEEYVRQTFEVSEKLARRQRCNTHMGKGEAANTRALWQWDGN